MLVKTDDKDGEKVGRRKEWHNHAEWMAEWQACICKTRRQGKCPRRWRTQVTNKSR